MKNFDLAFEEFFKLASASAWIETRTCVKTKSTFCPGDWKRPDGKDLSASKDFSSTQARIMHLFYAYNAFLGVQKIRNKDKALIIDAWFGEFSDRNQIPKNVYFGLDLVVLACYCHSFYK